jgi:hypothetical protein
MTLPLPLMDSGSNLPSPLFQPRPGWGGKISAWIRRNFYTLAFRIVVFAILIAVGTFITRRAPQEAILPSVSPTPLATAYTETAAPGEGISHLAARALDRYLEQHNTTLDTLQHLWAVNQLSASQALKRGQEVSFSSNAIGTAIDEAKSLTAGQRANLQQYIR